ncbi:MAG: FGGY family carbohydrate kinase [Lachnospiraceae bacterium]|nr:FGGY family carbohydrate kinase [Lachnospiraceae bacterium]
MSKYFMGIDAGTGSVRVAIFDENGTNMAYDVQDYSSSFPKNGWAEQDDKGWWEALKKAISECIRKSGVAPEEIIGISCDGTSSTTIFLDENGDSVRTPILWMDVRSSAEAASISELGKDCDVIKFYRSGVPAESLIPKCMWVKKHEPENWAKTVTIFELTSWLHWKLSGRKTTNMSVAAFRWLYDDKNGGYPVDLYKAIGLEDIIDKFPKDVLKTGTPIGPVDKEVAKELGLSEKTIVVEGTLDAVACMCGVGSVKAGGMALIGGTSSCLFGLSETEFHEPGVNGTYPNLLYDGTSLVEGGQASSGGILTWFRNNLVPKEWAEEAESRNMNIYDLITEKAESIPIGSDGLIMIDYFQGNRAPYSDSDARGIFWGLSLGTTTAHMARAVYEGVAYGACHCILTMKEAGYDVEEIYACGGLAQSDFWMQMHADITGVPMYTTMESQSAGCLGNSMIVAVGCGVYKDLQEAAEKMVKIDKTFLPNMENHEKYKFYMDCYMETWPQMRDLVHKAVKHVNN